MSKRAKEGVPDELIQIVRTIALTSSDPKYEAWETESSSGEYYYQGDPHSNGINTTKGRAIRAYVLSTLETSPIDIESLFSTLEQVAKDDSSAVRASLIEFLPYLLRFDGDRVVSIFEVAVEGRPEVLATGVSGSFIYYALNKHGRKMLRHIALLRHSNKKEARESCGRLATLAYLTLPEAKDLYFNCLRGDAALRRGVAEVLARNVDQSKFLVRCLNGLRFFLNDPDQDVRRAVGGVFRHMPSPRPQIRNFVSKFLRSKSLADGSKDAVEYASRIQDVDPRLAIEIAEQVQLALGKSLVDIRTAAAIVEDDLVHVGPKARVV